MWTIITFCVAVLAVSVGAGIGLGLLICKFMGI
jgi:hypothetical protein